MFSTLIFVFLSFFSIGFVAQAQEPKNVPVWELPPLEPAVIFVAISEVTMSTGNGTSEELNILVEHYGSQVGNLEYQLAKTTKHQKRRVDVYNKDNVRFYKTKKREVNPNHKVHLSSQHIG